VDRKGGGVVITEGQRGRENWRLALIGGKLRQKYNSIHIQRSTEKGKRGGGSAGKRGKLGVPRGCKKRF